MQVGVPCAPVNVRTADVMPTTASVSWTKPKPAVTGSFEPPADDTISWLIQVNEGKDESSSPWITMETISPADPADDYNATIHKLKPSTTYHVRILGVNKQGKILR